MQLEIVNQSGQPVPREFLKSWIRRLDRKAERFIKPERYRKKTLLIAFLSEAPARALNKRYRGKNYATDVLSFDSLEPESLGELIICPTIISRQAREHGLLVREELGYMVIHGFLHLLGYDHEKSESQARQMFKIQDNLFDALLTSGSPAGRSKR